MQLAANIPWHQFRTDDVLTLLKTNSATGLSQAEVLRRRVEHGPNKLAEVPPAARWINFLGQLNQVVIWILLGATILSRKPAIRTGGRHSAINCSADSGVTEANGAHLGSRPRCCLRDRLRQR
jgi:hypothetical protein